MAGLLHGPGTTLWAACIAVVSRTHFLQEDFMYIQQDLAKMFDTIRLPHLLMTLDRFGALWQSRELVSWWLIFTLAISVSFPMEAFWGGRGMRSIVASVRDAHYHRCWRQW